MTRQLIVRSSPAAQRSRRLGEMAGGGAGKCAALCCCLPCAVLHFVVLAVYTVPKGLMKKAVHQRRKRRRLPNETTNNKKNDVVLFHQRSATSGTHNVAVGPTLLEEFLADEEKSDAVALENEMWARFAGTGFWRSQSQSQP